MRLFNTRLLLIALLVPIFFFLGRTAYTAYQEYTTYTRNQHAVHTLDLLKEGDTLLDALAQESLASIQPLSADGTRQVLRDKRSATDAALERMFSAYSSLEDARQGKELNDFKERIDRARNLVDKGGKEYRTILYDLYGPPTAHLLQTVLERTMQTETILHDSPELQAYHHLFPLKSNTQTEEALVGYLLRNKKPFAPEDYQAWDSLLTHTQLPPLGHIGSPAFASQLRTLLQPDTFGSIAQTERAFVSAEGISGNYSVTPKTWLELLGSKSNRLGIASRKLLDHSHKTVQNAALENRQNAINALLQALLLLALMLFLIYLIQRIAREKKLLESTLKNIEFDLSSEKKAELQRVVKQRDSRAIYSFLSETIKESNRAKDLFLANMSHEIRTPLNGIVGFTQLLKTTPLNHDQEEFVHVIEESSEHLLTIVNDILDLSKIKAEKIELEEVAFNPIDKFESAIETYGAKALQKNIDFGVFIDPSLPRSLIGDPTRVSQVLVNLVSNAIKFTSSYGEVSVFCEKVDEKEDTLMVKFAVKDSGIGISPEQQQRIFDAFSQADSSTTRKFGGTGLGLSISSKLVSLMGGELKIDSVPGEGATFYFTLPFKRDPEAPTDERPQFPDLTVGLMLPKRDIDRQVDRNLEAYVRYLGADFKIYYEDEVYKMHPQVLPKILFVDQRYNRREGEIERILELQTYVALLASSHEKDKLNLIADRLGALIYKPINYTKTLKTLQQYAGEKGNKPKVHAEDETFENLHILVAEDNRINQKLITTTLNNFGIDVTIAANGQEAVMLRRQNDYDLILMDIQMPVMNGIEATQAILDYEAATKQPHVPIIALTANALRGDREKYLQAGMDNYTPKPINLDQLRQIIRQYHPDKVKKTSRSADEPIEAPAERSADIQALSSSLSAETVDTESAAPQTQITESAAVLDEPEAAVSATPSQPTASETEDQPASGDKILMFFRDPFVSNVHLQLLTQEHTCDLVRNEAAFLEHLDRGGYGTVLIAQGLLPTQDCYIADILRERGIRIYQFGEQPSECEGVASYTTLAELTQLMRSSDA